MKIVYYVDVNENGSKFINREVANNVNKFENGGVSCELSGYDFLYISYKDFPSYSFEETKQMWKDSLLERMELNLSEMDRLLNENLMLKECKMDEQNENEI